MSLLPFRNGAPAVPDAHNAAPAALVRWGSYTVLLYGRDMLKLH
jgi:hypothetical protein